MVPLPPENPMKTKHRSLILAFVFSTPFLASAQTEQAPPQPSFIANLFFTLLPILLIGAFIWFFFVRQIRGISNNRMDEIQRHNLAVEKLFERIAIALEKKDQL
jgi:hypothetical protein